MENIDEKVKKRKEKALSLNIFEKVKTAAIILGKRKSGSYTGGGGGLSGDGFAESYETYKLRKDNIELEYTTSRLEDDSGNDSVCVSLYPLGGLDIFGFISYPAFYQENHVPNKNWPEPKEVHIFKNTSKWLRKVSKLYKLALVEEDNEKARASMKEQEIKRREIREKYGI